MTPWRAEWVSDSFHEHDDDVVRMLRMNGRVCVRPHLFGDGVQGRGRLVVQEDGRILQHGAGDGDALLLPA